MRKYLSFMRCGFLDGCAYRNNFITGMLANFIQVAVLYYVWKSIFQYQSVVNGYTWDIMRRYVFVAFLCNSAFSFGFEMSTSGRIIKGDIIMDLLKPVSYRSMVFFRMLGTAGMEFTVTLVLIGIFYIGVNGAAGLSIWRTLLFFLSLFLGMGIKFGIQYLFSLLCFYTDNSYGVTKAREVLTNFFSGAILPLVMFPGVLRNVVEVLPFQGIVFTPCSIFIGTFTLQECVQGMLVQMIWIVLLWILGSLFWKKASGVISLYGG